MVRQAIFGTERTLHLQNSFTTTFTVDNSVWRCTYKRHIWMYKQASFFNCESLMMFKGCLLIIFHCTLFMWAAPPIYAQYTSIPLIPLLPCGNSWKLKCFWVTYPFDQTLGWHSVICLDDWLHDWCCNSTSSKHMPYLIRGLPSGGHFKISDFFRCYLYKI